MVFFQILVFVASVLFVGGSWILWWSQTRNSDQSPKKPSAFTTILPVSSPTILPVSSPTILPVANYPVSSPDCSTCPTDYSAATESFSMACSPNYNLQPVEEEAVHHDIVESLQLYEEKVKEVDKMNLIVNDLIEKGRCPEEYFTLLKEGIMNLNKMNEMLGIVISAGLQQGRVLGHKNHNLLEQANNQFMRINQ